jgi:hypothetical protein
MGCDRDVSYSAYPNEQGSTEYRNIFTLHPENAFIVKLACRMSR